MGPATAMGISARAVAVMVRRRKRKKAKRDITQSIPD
jgi:hypothetical protein